MPKINSQNAKKPKQPIKLGIKIKLQTPNNPQSNIPLIISKISSIIFYLINNYKVGQTPEFTLLRSEFSKVHKAIMLPNTNISP